VLNSLGKFLLNHFQTIFFSLSSMMREGKKCKFTFTKNKEKDETIANLKKTNIFLSTKNLFHKILIHFSLNAIFQLTFRMFGMQN